MQDNPFSVSVVIPAYNLGCLVERSIISVLAQTHQPDEIIVIDDGSNDDTADHIKKFGDRIKYIYQTNAGLAAARNTGIRNANCRWIAFLDGDDEWLENFLLRQIALLESNPQLKWSLANALVVFEQENLTRAYVDPDYAGRRLGGKDYYEDFFDVYKSVIKCATGSTLIIASEVFCELGTFDESLRYAEDMDMLFRISLRYPPVGYVAEPLGRYYLQRPGSLTADTETRKQLSIISGIFDKYLELAKGTYRRESLERCVAGCLKRLFRSYIFEFKMADAIRSSCRKYSRLLPVNYRLYIWLLTVWPRASAFVFHMISRAVRKAKVRKEITAPPRRSALEER